MTTPANLRASLADLLMELEAAVRAGDRARATESNGRSCNVWGRREGDIPNPA